ncbi:hypothetical protein BOTBODRAFT_146533 [Botryobasidium botryosum FD-172 SS1]|uniref:F-box domain-containing protein n=1 Tax=Botryobasidium botryosum (strain FD-172 SS1) TaxID=930990 RepID=A0A067MLH9_BOTB1|nr:hypothetical protein BOTBODRAFT_146533 [Botryobasidium botryosum FD-172 SS1]
MALDAALRDQVSALIILGAVTTAPTLVYRLPSEVLASVFELVVDYDACEPMSARAPFQLAGVSRWWREVALTVCALWAKINREVGSSADLVDIFFVRSRLAMLDVELAMEEDLREFGMYHWHFPQREQQEQCVLRVLKALLQHNSRLRSLFLENVSVAHDELLFPAPQLEVFRCVGPDRFPPSRVPSVPINIFAGHSPRLRALRLNMFHIALESSIYVGLTTLHLEAIHYTTSIRDLIRVIKACPLLEELKLSRVSFALVNFPTVSRRSRSSPPVHTEPITLAMLRRTEIYRLDPEVTNKFFTSVVVPPSSLLVLSLCWNDDFNNVI